MTPEEAIEWARSLPEHDCIEEAAPDHQSGRHRCQVCEALVTIPGTPEHHREQAAATRHLPPNVRAEMIARGEASIDSDGDITPALDSRTRATVAQLREMGRWPEPTPAMRRRRWGTNAVAQQQALEAYMDEGQAMGETMRTLNEALDNLHAEVERLRRSEEVHPGRGDR